MKENNADFVAPRDILGELRQDNQQLTRYLRSTQEVRDRVVDGPEPNGGKISTR